MNHSRMSLGGMVRVRRPTSASSTGSKPQTGQKSSLAWAWSAV